MHAWNRVLSTICFCFFLKMSSRYASKMHCESCLMLSLSCNWFHFHREVLRHSHTLVHVHTQATQSVDLWPEEPCYSLKYRPASADVRPVWVAGRWSVSDLSVWLQKTIPPLPLGSARLALASVQLQQMLKSRPRAWVLTRGPAVELPWQTAKYLGVECLIHSKRPTPWLPLSKVNLPGRVGNFVQYICTPGSEPRKEIKKVVW